MHVKRFFCFCLILLPIIAFARHKPYITYLTKDSLTFELQSNWRFHLGDSAGMEAPDVADSTWAVVNPGLYRGDNPKHDYEQFSSIAWLRLHFVMDSTLVMHPLALDLKHYGASQVFLDGKRIATYGVINGKDSSEYTDPQSIPLPFVISSAGEHVLAIRYANYDAERNQRIFNRNFAGFIINIGQARTLMEGDHIQTIGITAVMMFLVAFFVAFSLLHLFLYLYHRTSPLNLYFSIFCLSLSVLFFIPFVNRFTEDPSKELYSLYIVVFFSASACYSLSGFNNELFSKKKLRFYIITVCCIIAPFLWRISAGIGVVTYIGLIALVMLESVVLVIAGIYRKVKGARIIGAGILFFALFFLTVISLVLTVQNFDINDSTASGKIFELFLIGAILSMPVSMSIYLAWSFAAINKDLKNQLQQVKLLSDRTLQQELEKQHLLEGRKEELEKEVAQRTEEVTAQKREIEKQHDELKVEKKKSDDLLLNILPEEVAEELKQTGFSEAKFFDHVSVLFTDFVDFTKAGERMSPQELVDELHNCFKAFDDIISSHGIEKIKTIGDAYLAVCGLPLAIADHAERIARAAIEINEYMVERRARLGDRTFDIRIGIHSGSVVAGIVGVKKFAYDIWGDTVNTAARMEQNSERGRINISQVTYELIKHKFVCKHRGEIVAKNKGALSMYFIESER